MLIDDFEPPSFPFVVLPDRSVQPVAPAGAVFTLEELRRAIGGGYIEMLDLGRDRLVVIDEEGKLAHRDLAFNELATLLIQRYYDELAYAGGDRRVFGDWIAGPALFLTREHVD